MGKYTSPFQLIGDAIANTIDYVNGECHWALSKQTMVWLLKEPDMRISPAYAGAFAWPVSIYGFPIHYDEQMDAGSIEFYGDNTLISLIQIEPKW